MARECRLSVSRFREVFCACTHLSPKQFLIQVRMSQARSLFATEPMLSVAEVSARVGMPDPRHFHKAYKDTFGETPRRREV